MSEIPIAYFEKLANRCQAIDSSLCVGLDPDTRRLPTKMGSGPEAVYRFCVDIIEATADFAAAFKPNIAFFESIGVEGWHVLSQVMEAIPREIPVIIDAKRGDIGSTAQHYARSIFERLKADAVTVNPFMGHDSVDPFLAYERRGVYLLCLTSNHGAHDFQLHDDLYLRVAQKANDWNEKKNIGLVVGATKPKHLAEVQRVSPDLPILIPGLGAQGGDLEELLNSASKVPRHHMLFNVSRSIIFVSQGADFGHSARKAAIYYRDMINKAREMTGHD
jgi:orotidine-5'-phosphate decarboxylase